MNYEDRVTKEYIEAALANAGPKIVAGTYDGDGSASRFIDLGFTPKAVLVMPMTGETSYSSMYYYGGLAVYGFPVKKSGYNIVEVVDGGFNVMYLSLPGTTFGSNQGGYTFHYIAIA